MAEARLADCTTWAKVLVRASQDGALARKLGVEHGSAGWSATPATGSALTVGWKPDAWLLLSPDEPGVAMVERTEALVDGEFASVVDVTHGHWMGRLTGSGSARTLAGWCAIDLAVARNGRAFRTLVAGVTATVIRDDVAGVPSYLVLCDRSYGDYVEDVIARH